MMQIALIAATRPLTSRTIKLHIKMQAHIETKILEADEPEAAKTAIQYFISKQTLICSNCLKIF